MLTGCAALLKDMLLSLVELLYQNQSDVLVTLYRIFQ
jgi:hypothetical protein